MILSHKIALNPTVKQRIYFAKAAGCDRFVYNLALEMWNAEYAAGKKPNANDLKKQFNSIKYQQYPWMREVHRDAHADPFSRVQSAWVSYFKALKRKDKRVQRPRFHRKNRKASFYVANDKFNVENHQVKLPVIGQVQMFEELRFSGKIMGAVISRTADRWFISISVEVQNPERQRTGNGIAGVDWGIKNALTITREDGLFKTVETIQAPKPLLFHSRKLRVMQRSLSRRKKGGSNRKKLVRRIARVHARVAAIREDFWNKITTRLCRENQAVGIETLNTSGMLKNHKLARAINDVGCSVFRQKMEYKAKLYSTLLAEADPYYPSSKTCNRCGAIKKVLTLGERVFYCDQCGHVQDRDVNASENLCKLAKRLLLSAQKAIMPGDSNAVMLLDEPGTTTCTQKYTK